MKILKKKNSTAMLSTGGDLEAIGDLASYCLFYLFDFPEQQFHIYLIFVLKSVSATPKSSKGTAGRSGYDDSTLPLVDKSQGQFC